jgi:hypothetical protein
MTESRLRRLAGFAGLLLVGFHAVGGLVHQHGLNLTHDGALWEFEHFLLLPCQLPAGDPPDLSPVGMIGLEAPSFAVEAPTSPHPSRGPPARDLRPL